ncbi:unnamed protein product [Clonostachys rhizophaga]|uniref:Major facilitator superfamily (MFS) profile domain-containing protein n=1 Tax=Clonostachys rhizophaga TaxID=160324 RepID=A0A9N9VUX7_9HYPO|nr:unnamed protein product [Clonostachys rhizophaga]
MKSPPVSHNALSSDNSAAPEMSQQEEPVREQTAITDFDTIRRSFSFWAIIVGLGVMLLLAALENSVLVTSAPSILAEIPLGDDWIWLTNAFFLASAAFQPLLGQLTNLYGRRWTTIGVIVIFIVGSTICGVATNTAMLLAGRAVQGIGSGGILMAYDTIVSDLVPLRYRGNYIAVILLIYSIGLTLGPLVGGVIVDKTTWRWVFYINLPVGAVSLAVMYFYLHLNYRSEGAAKSRLMRIDMIGNLILIGSSVSMLIALTYAGTRHPWSSWNTLVPLLVGFAGFLLFGAFENSRFAPLEPVMPPRLFNNRTSVIIAINTFLFTAVLYWTLFFLPVYFQTVALTSPTRAGVNLIPVSLLGVPAAAAAAAAVTRWGKSKLIHIIGLALFTLGQGLFSRLDEDSTTAEFVGYIFVGPIGGGILLNTQLPAFQAPASEADQAAATASWNFIRTLGGVWGVAIPAAIFANRVDGLIHGGGAISNPLAAEALVGGGAYEFASAQFVESFPATDQVEIRAVYRLAYQRVQLVSLAFVGFALLLCLFERDVVLRTELVTDYGLKEKKSTRAADPEEGPAEGEVSDRHRSD